MNSVISIDDTLHAKMLTIPADWSEIANRAIRRQIALLDSVRYRGGDAFEKGMATAYDWIRDDADPDLVGRFVALTGRLEELLAPSELTVAEKTYRMLYPEVTWGTAKDFWKWVMGDQVSGIKNDRFMVGFIFGVAEAFKLKQPDDVPSLQNTYAHPCQPPTVTRNGRNYKMNTSKIGHTRARSKQTETAIADADTTCEVIGTAAAVTA